MTATQSTKNLKQLARMRAERRANTSRLLVGEARPFAAVSPRTANTVGESFIPASRKIRWRWGLLAACAMALLSLYPQIDLWVTRGADWQGSYTSLCYDEEVYGAYINALISGRPRRTEPLDVPDVTQPPHESLFSIQVVPAYFIASFIYLFRLTVAQAFIVLTPLMAFLAALMLFYLLASVTRDEALSALGALAVLICGTLAARHSVAVKWLTNSYWFGNFLFLRRYQPSVAFPLFFGFVLLAWQALRQQGREAWRAAIAAGAVFAVIIFSYFFMWTAAAAWLACFALVWLVARREEWSLVIKRLLPTAIFAGITFVPYALMLARRNPMTDKVQDLIFTHAPNFYRAPQIIGALALLLIWWGVKRWQVQWREPSVVLANSLSLMPFVVFNQQILTGHSLQPVHYEMYIANYVSLLALFLTLVILWRAHEAAALQANNVATLPRLKRKDSPQTAAARKRRLYRLLYATALRPALACLVLGWGVIEMQAVTAVQRPRNLPRDQFMPVAKRLAALSAAHGKGPNEREIVFSPDILVVSDNLAALAPQTALWATHTPFATSLSWEQLQERYFQYLFFCGVRPGTLARDLADFNMIAVGSLFTYERYLAGAVDPAKKLTGEEIAQKVRLYTDYIATFNKERARRWEFSYVVSYTKQPKDFYTKAITDFSNLDRWYQRDAGEEIGPFTLYQVKLWPEANPDAN